MSARRGTTSREPGSVAQPSDARAAMLAEIATLYWIDRLNQEQIAHHIGRSVPTVSRLLTEADEAGLIEVRVRHPVQVDAALQVELVRRFGLRTARVLAGPGEPERLLPRLGELAARYLSAVLANDQVISVGWGATLYETVRSLRPRHYRGIQVAQSLGSLGSKLPQIDNHLITRMLADALGGSPHFLPAPMIVENALVREALLQDLQVSETLALGRRADISLTGIGIADPGLAGVYRAGYIDDEALAAIRAAGAAGDILVEFFDDRGCQLHLEVTSRVIGLALADLEHIGLVVSVAGGEHKAPAILGALRTGLLHVLVTDEAAARRVLALADATDGEDACLAERSPLLVST